MIILFQQPSIRKQVSKSTGINSSRQYKGFSLRGVFYQQLIELLLAGHGVRDLLEAIYNNIGLPVMIISSAGEVLHYAGYDQCPGLAFTRSLEQHYFTHEEKPEKYSFDIDGKSIECLVLPLLQKKGSMAYFLIVALQGKNINRSMLELLQVAVRVLALGIDREDSLCFWGMRYQTEFILEILMDENPKKEKLKLASRVCGRNLEKPHLVFVVAFTSGEYKLKEKLLQVFKSNLKLIMDYNFLDLTHGDWHIVLIPEKEKGGNLQDIINLMRQVHRKTNMELPEGTRLFTACQSLMRQEYNLGKGYKEARFSLELGLLTGEGDSFIQFDEVGIYGLLFSICQNPKSASILSEYSKKKLSRLINNDMLYNTEFYSTLGTYLENDGNIAVAAEKLFIHPNTLRYRISKIEKLLNVNLSKFECIVDLAMAYKIDQLLKIQNVL